MIFGMSKGSKLEESRYFLNKLKTLRDELSTLRESPDPGHESEFRFILSAFLSASRSVLQYVYEDVRAKGQEASAWWRGQFDSASSGPVLRFFKQERDQNIHFSAVIPDVQGATYMSIGSIGPDLKEATMPDPIKYSVFSIRFANWNGNEDLISLCERYLGFIEEIVCSGQSRGFLQP